MTADLEFGISGDHILDDPKALHYALRCLHIAEQGATSSAASIKDIEISERALKKLVDLRFAVETAGGFFRLAETGEAKLKELGGPFSNWKQRSDYNALFQEA